MKAKNDSFQSKNFVLLIFLLLIESLFSRPIQAQVIPDSTLGNEKSSVNPIDALNERIDGGARRGGNLFHSFQEFNINEGKGVYFANPQGVMNIFSRVTGGNSSQILGRLGVLGQSNLFFLNPYGIIFGPNSSLDIRGSFVGTTADAVKFADGTVFSAINPQSNALLTISVPLGLQIGNQQTAIVNRGHLVVRQDFTLSAGNLDLQGQLSAGGNLTLEALNTILITDSITNPFIAYAGGQLTAQGNQFVKISILNHPDSGLFAGGDLILRSAFPIKADAHFWSGGSFRIEKLDGSLGSLSSADDPVIRASGDVSLDSYDGASLHIFAGGSVTIPGTVSITEVESAENSITETVTLSNGTTVVIDGSVEPTLDIRAGTLAVGSPLYDTGTPTSADISIGSIEVYDAVNGTGGKVFLTNQYQPNTVLSSSNGITVGGIDTRDVLDGGSVIIDARSGINLTGILTASALNLSNSFDVPPTYLGNGGDITLLSQGNINANSSILAQGLSGGNVILNTTADVLLDQGLEINVRGGGGGSITINAQNVSLLNTSKLRAGIETGFGTPEAQAGDIKINATGIITIADSSFISNAVLADSIGNGGDIEITTNSLSLIDGGQISTRTFSRGNAGAIKITATDTISTAGEGNQGNRSGIFSTVQETGEGNSGSINISTGSLSLTDGTIISATTSGRGNAGAIRITASDTISLSGENSERLGSSIFNGVAETAEGNSGGIEITANSLSLSDGANVNVATFGKGNTGAVKITATDSISVAGQNSSQTFVSAIFNTVEETGEGNSGGIDITTGSLFLNNGGAITASTLGKGNAGAIKITANDTISLNEANSRIVSGIAPEAVGNSGGIEITTGSLFLENGGIVSASTEAKGNAGAIKITANDSISLESSQGFINYIVSQVGPEAVGDSGGIEITTGSLFLENGAEVSANTYGKGNAGAIKITANDSISLSGVDSHDGLGSFIDSRVQEETAQGNAGGIEITTGSLSISDGGGIAASTIGKGNAGAIKITANGSISLSGVDSHDGLGSFIESTVKKETAQGNSEGLEITTGSLSLNDTARISTRTDGTGTAGNITINANILTSNGGSEISTDTQTNFDAGNLTLNIADNLTLSNSNLIAETTGEGKAGNITINAPQLNLTDGAIITAQTSALGNGGSITVNAPISVILGENSQLNVETSNAGQAGNIDITSNTVTIGKNAEISATATATATNTTGGGSITINASNLNLSGKLGIFAETQGQSPAGNLTLKPDGNQPNLNIQFTDTALISARTTNQGTGGSINISSPQIINIAGEGKITVETTGSGLAGNINITTQQLNIGNQTEITASTTGTNNAGNINLNANQINLQGAIINAYTDGTGSAGSINLSYQGNNANSINLDNSTISTEIRENAQVNPNIEATPSNISLNADTITLTNNSLLSARTKANLDAGTVNINSNTLNLSQNSQIETLTQSSAKAGSIMINANQQITIKNADSGLFAQTSSSGQAGSIIINSPQFTLAEGATIQASTSSSGNGGSITINAPISLILGEKSQLNVETSGAGQAGNIDITSNTVTIGKDAEISATATLTATNTSGGGSINIKAFNLNIAGKLGIFAETQGIAPAGTLTLNPVSSNPNLSISFIEQGLISASTSASGNGGDINISAPNNIDIKGNGTIATETSGSGHAGTINLNTNQLNLASGIRISASTIGTGNAGDINLDANQINLQQATVTAFTNSGGNAGSILVPNAQTIALDNSTISTEIQTQGNATQASNITLTSNTLELNNSNITASTSGVGNAGEIKLINQQLTLNNNSKITAISTGIGNAGSISLPDTQNLNLNQSEISVSTAKQGNAGSITVPTAQNITLNQSQITASTSGVGDTGTIELTGTEQIALTNNSEISNAVLTEGTGNAQTIILNTPSLTLENSTITSSTDGTGNAGSINIPNAQTIALDNSTISTEIQTQGNATEPSNITLTSDTLNLNNNSQINASTSGVGNAGEITLINRQLELNNSQVSATSTGVGNAGSISLPSTQNLNLNQSQISVSTTKEGNAGSIIVPTAQKINLNQSQITASTSGVGDTGVINLSASEKIELSESEISNAVETSGVGNAKEITLNTPQLSLHNSSISSSTDGMGNAGSINIPNAQTIALDNSTISTEIQPNGRANLASNITLKSDTLNLNNSNITASSQGTGDAGNLTIRVQNALTSNNSTIATSAEQASGGGITISAQDIRLQGNSDIRTSVASGTGGGGDITLTADSILAFDDSDILAFAQDGIGGNITLNTPVFFGDGYQATDENQNPNTLNNNNRVDINASGAVSGIISIPDLTFIQNSLFELPETLINTENLLANSCVVPNQQKAGTFILTGAEGLPTRPNNNLSSPYPTGTVESIPKSSSPPKIEEPQGFYRLSNGMVVLSKKCY